MALAALAVVGPRTIDLDESGPLATVAAGRGGCRPGIGRLAAATFAGAAIAAGMLVVAITRGWRDLWPHADWGMTVIHLMIVALLAIGARLRRLGGPVCAIRVLPWVCWCSGSLQRACAGDPAFSASPVAPWHPLAVMATCPGLWAACYAIQLSDGDRRSSAWRPWIGYSGSQAITSSFAGFCAGLDQIVCGLLFFGSRRRSA